MFFLELTFLKLVMYLQDGHSRQREDQGTASKLRVKEQHIKGTVAPD
jgi:hypothetical protein